LCRRIMERELYKTDIRDEPIGEGELKKLGQKIQEKFPIGEEELDYFLIRHTIENSAYDTTMDKIKILYKDGSLEDIATASDLSNLESLTKRVKKYTISYPKEIIG